MIIYSPTISGSLSFQQGGNSLTGTTANLTGSFSGSLVGTFEGTFSTEATANISGAFNEVSGALSDRIAAQESFSGSLSTTSAIYSGSFSGSFVGDGSQLSGVTSYTDQDTLDYINTLGVLSGSAQIKEDISGSFTDLSSSLEQRITPLEDSVSSLNAATSSYLLNTTDTLDGDLTVTGKITAQEFHTEFVSASIIYQSGSTKFGDSSDDTHSFTGSVNVSNGITGNLTGNVTGNASTATSASYVTFAANADTVDNLQASQFLRSDADDSTTGNLSIANTQPKLRLKETDSTDVDKEILVSGGTFYIRNLNDNDTAGSNLFLVDSAGNTTVQGTLNVSSISNGGALNLTAGSAFEPINLDSSYTYTDTLRVSRIRTVTGTEVFNVGGGNPYLSGNVGIGTTSPGSSLHVIDTIRVQDGTQNIWIGGGYNGGGYIEYSDSSTAADNFSFFVGGTGMMELSKAGWSDTNTDAIQIKNVDLSVDYDTLFVDISADRVGINTLTPAATLDVNGRIRNNAGIEIFYIDSPNSSGNSTYGWNTFIHIGKGSELPNVGTFPTNTPASSYGIFFNTNSDGLFVGVDEYATGNYQPVIRWGDDANENLIFYHNSTQIASLTYTGAFTATSKNFKIDHPLESKKDTHYLYHSSVESPQINNIYRGKVTLENGTATVNLDSVSSMTEGTFIALNTNLDVFLTNNTGWDNVKGSIDENILTITCQNNNSADTVSWMVVGERKDPTIMSTDITDENGKLIVEQVK